MHLGLFILGTGSHIAGWRWPGAVTDFSDLDAIQQIARTAERGRFDLIFMGDNLYADPGAHPSYTLRLEPLTMMAALATATRHIGLGATLSTTFYPPYHLARSLGTLDLMSGGGVAWNVVASHGRLELSQFLTPAPVADHRNAPVNSLGYLRVMFAVDDLDDTLAPRVDPDIGKSGAGKHFDDIGHPCRLRREAQQHDALEVAHHRNRDRRDDALDGADRVDGFGQRQRRRQRHRQVDRAAEHARQRGGRVARPDVGQHRTSAHRSYLLPVIQLVARLAGASALGPVQTATIGPGGST